ncbi:hypothetical protein RHGRI_004322 [Rhododendron griersonianum]|uniref:Uncharacterized protein n=1 Tax=Rhododendron griersonianum TaxID=479676 RepID=A0AAV6LAI0_9ERIC|nr:hypothetical protein RHGRI_004322 [Rhododendron griersonianum]
MQEDAPPLIQTDIRMQHEGMEITVEEVVRNAKKQTVEEERVPTPREVIYNFSRVTWMRCRSLAAAGSFLTMLHDSVRDWNQTPIRAFTPAMEQELQALSLDLEQVGFDIGWMTQRGYEVLAVGRRREVQERIRVLTDRMESVRKQVADIEGELAEAQLKDLELAAGAPHEFDPDESVFGGMLPL